MPNNSNTNRIITTFGLSCWVMFLGVLFLLWTGLWYFLVDGLKNEDNEGSTGYSLIIFSFVGVIVIFDARWRIHIRNKYVTKFWKWFKKMVIIFPHIILFIGIIKNHAYWRWSSSGIIVIYLAVVKIIWISECICCRQEMIRGMFSSVFQRANHIYYVTTNNTDPEKALDTEEEK